MYILLVAPPGVGKSQAIEKASQMWRAVQVEKKSVLHVAPDSVTRASLLDTLGSSSTKVILPSGEFQIYHALNIASSEFGVLCPAHDLEFLNTLNELYDAKKMFEEARRGREQKVLAIDYPLLHILAGTQPHFLSALLPEQAWGMGFTARTIMIYSAQTIKVNIFNNQQSIDPNLQRNLISDLTGLSQQYGAMNWTNEAQIMLTAWYGQDLTPVPTHSRLQNYNTRRLLHVLKLCMISSLSRSNDFNITVEDVQRAQDWLLDAEDRMPDIFRDMAGTSDKAVLDDMHSFLWQIYLRKKDSIHESFLIRYISGKVPSEKVMRIIELAERSHLIERDTSKAHVHWKPRPLNTLPGVE